MDKNKIKVSDIASAEKILGIEYSKEEREQMITDLEDQIISNKMRRKNKFSNNVPTASKFDPRLPNFKMPPSSGLKIRKRNEIIIKKYNKPKNNLIFFAFSIDLPEL